MPAFAGMTGRSGWEYGIFFNRFSIKKCSKRLHERLFGFFA
jgi:hypothetical protein